jgi:thiol-disulfide isomerase/thioredoxin
MKKILLISCIISNFCYGQQSNVNIKGNISGIGNDTVFIWRYLISNTDKIITDTVFSKDGKFTYNIFLNKEAALAIIPNKSFVSRVDGTKFMPQGRFIELFISPKDSIRITGKLEPYYLDYLAKGTSLNQEYSIKRNDFKIPEIEASKIEILIDSLSAFPETKEERNKLFNQRIEKQNEVTETMLKFVNNNLDNDVSAYFLSRVSLNSFAKYYPKLTEKVRSGFFNGLLTIKYTNYLKYTAAQNAEKELTENTLSPFFELNDLNGQNHKLSDFKGKYIVLDFWGTWCGPCMAELPRLKALYDSLKTKVSFIGIACHDTKEDLKKTIIEHQVNWLQLINTDENDISVLYGVQAYPTKIIIDKNLKIVKRFVGLDEEFYKLLTELTK